MEYLLIPLVALAASALTLFSGFGLGTLLTPVFALFFPVDVAIALTAVVHLLNNLFKLGLVGKHADTNTVLRFGIPAMLAAFVGAYVLHLLGKQNAIASWSLGNKTFEILPINSVMGLLIIGFAFLELIPSLASLTINKKYLIHGGILSGFFGGLSGNQGAFRSMFLLKSGLSKEAYIATGVLIACMVDVARLTLYSDRFLALEKGIPWMLLISAILAAFVGAYVGARMMKKVTLKAVQILVGILLIMIGVAMAGGMIVN